MVKLLRVFNSPKHLFMAMEALEGRPLHREIRRLGRLHEDRSRHLFKQVNLDRFRNFCYVTTSSFCSMSERDK